MRTVNAGVVNVLDKQAVGDMNPVDVRNLERNNATLPR